LGLYSTLYDGFRLQSICSSCKLRTMNQSWSVATPSEPRLSHTRARRPSANSGQEEGSTTAEPKLVLGGGPAGNISEKIAARAYELYEARGCEHGHDLEDWLSAEAEIASKSQNQAE
jgi:Protein of unknown function (DUF2934)